MNVAAGYSADHDNFRIQSREDNRCRIKIDSRESGFNLLELLITLSVFSILVAIAVPSYRNSIVSNRLTSSTNDFIAATNMARLEAVRRNRPVQFCASSGNGTDALGTRCSALSPGAVVVLEPDNATTTMLYQAPMVPSNLSLSATVALRYNGQGLASNVGGTLPAYSGLLLDLSTTELSTGNHRCVYVTTGNAVSTCSYTATSGGCPTSEPSTCQ